MDLSIVLKTIVWWCVTCFESEMVVVCYRRKLIAKSLPDMVTIDKLPYTNYDYSYVSTLQGVIQSNPVFIVKTQLTERSRITEKHRENHIKKTSRTLKTRKKVMRMPVMKSVGVFVQQSIIKLLAARCPFFSGRVMLWRRFRRLCWESDLGGNSSSRTWYAQYRTFENNRSSASSTSSSAVITDSQTLHWMSSLKHIKFHTALWWLICTYINTLTIIVTKDEKLRINYFKFKYEKCTKSQKINSYTRKSINRSGRPYNLYCVGADLKPCSTINRWLIPDKGPYYPSLK